jgi:hypothetical protein
MSKERDEELDILLSGAKKIEPTADQITEWKKAIQNELVPKRHPRFQRYLWAGQLAAALATGFLLGHSLHFEDSNKSEPVATIQYVFAKSE